MATITEKLKWLIDADATSAIKGFKAAGDSADKELGKAQSRTDKLGGTLTKTGAGALAFSGIVGGALVKCAGSFEDLALSAGKMANSTGLSTEEASRWIEVAGDMGIGADTIEGALGKMNKTLGASPQKFADLGIQIAATKDGTEDVNGTFLNTIDRLQQIEDPAARAAAAAQIFGKGWQGAAELLSLSTDDIKTQLASVSDQKVINDAELQKAKDYRADLDHLSDSVQNLGLAIGQGAAPMIGALASVVGTAVDAVAQLDKVTSGAAGGLLAAGTAAIGAIGGVSLLAGQFLKLKTRFVDPATGALNNFGRVASVAAALAAGAVLAYTIDAQQGAEATANLQASIEDLSRVSDADLLNTFVGTIVKGYYAEKDLTQTTNELAQANLEGAERVRAMIEAHIAAGTASQNEKDSIGALITSIDDEKLARQQGKKTTDEYKDSTEDATSATLGQTVATMAAKGATEEATRAVDAHKEHTKQMVDSITAGLDAVLVKWDALSGDIDADKSLLNLQTTFDDVKAKAEAAFTAAATGADDAEQQVRDAQIATDDLKLAVIDYGQKVLGLPPEKVTKMLALIDAGQLELVEAQLNALARNRTVNLDIVAKGGAGYSNLPRFASGTDRARRGLALVGEKGPELVEFDGGETVHTAASTAALLRARRTGGPAELVLDAMAQAASNARSRARANNRGNPPTEVIPLGRPYTPASSTGESGVVESIEEMAAEVAAGIEGVLAAPVSELAASRAASHAQGECCTTNNITINMPGGSNGDDVVRAIKQFEARNGPAWRAG